MSTRTTARAGVGVVVAGVLAACGPVPGGHPSSTPGADRQAWTGRVVAVLDGDTVDVERGGQRVRVRLLGIDAPELAHDGSQEQCGAQAARKALDGRVWHREVTVQPDTEADVSDRYGRTLAYVWLGQLDVGMAQVSDGLAGAWSPSSAPTPSRQDSYRRAADLARSDKRGSWSRCGRLGRA